MNYAIILAGGTGQRMKQTAMPKQFLELFGKPIIIYTLEAFSQNKHIDQIIIPCNKDWISYMGNLVSKYQISKVTHIVAGGKDRAESVNIGLNAIASELSNDDIVTIHDGVRPLVQQETITSNIKTAAKFGNAITVHQNIETVVVTKEKFALWDDFKNRNNTYTLTAPQTFRAKELISALTEVSTRQGDSEMPLLDAALAYASLGKKIYLVPEEGNNLKITTPEDYFYLKAFLEAQENKHIWGI